MDRNEIIRYWLESADEDFVVAEHLLQAGDHLWCLFAAHLVVEKALKAAVVSLSQGHAPPIHNLVRLAQLAGIDVDEPTGELFAELTRFNIEARYPKDKQALRAIATEAYARRKLAAVRGVLKWIQNALN
jgi:HEPN domain-containing protein